VRPRAISAPRNRFAQDSFHGPQIGDLASHVGQMGFGDDTHLGARTLALIRETKQRPHLTDGESKQAGATDEIQTLQVLRPVEPVTAFTS
jgi:hypothetical protein